MGGFTKKAAELVFEKPKQPQRQVQQEAVKVAPKGPTIAELPQDKRRAVGRRGRRATILTSSKGVDENLTLGYKTLLGE